MTASAKSAQLRAQLESLDNSLESSNVQSRATPAPRKIDEGNDRWGGYP